MADDAWRLPGGNLRIPKNEVTFQASRGGGPGGQHVNKTSTRIELWWHPASSTALTEPQKALLAERLAHRLDADGWLRLVESGSRSQLRNREAVAERWLALIARALKPAKPRKRTGVPRQEKERRLEAKRQRGSLKRQRGPVHRDE